MILFLDSVAPTAQFLVFDNNKVIESLDILDKNNTKISDVIHNKFDLLNKKYNLLDLLNHLIICTGPGSYTSLRVGMSFMLGISYAKNIPIKGVSHLSLLNEYILENEFFKTLIIICSGNKQNFVCLPINEKKSQYDIFKINDNDMLSKINLNLYTRCLSNHILPGFIYNKVEASIKKLEYIDFKNKLRIDFIENLESNNVLQPIYISDNQLLN